MKPATKELNKIPDWMWSSTEASAATAWGWYSGYWSNLTKGNSNGVVSFFANCSLLSCSKNK